MEIQYRAAFNPHGFKESDISDDEWKQIADEFMRLRNVYCRIVNGIQGYETINKDFDELYPTIENVGGDGVDAYLYGAYMSWRTMALIRYYSTMTDKFDSDILQPIVIMDGPFSDFGARLKKHGSWYIDMTLAPVEEDSP